LRHATQGRNLYNPKQRGPASIIAQVALNFHEQATGCVTQAALLALR